MRKQVTVACQLMLNEPPITVGGIEDSRFPGLAVCDNPEASTHKWIKHKHAIIHLASGLIMTTASFKTTCWRIVEQLGPLGDWTQTPDKFDRATMMVPARTICREQSRK